MAISFEVNGAAKTVDVDPRLRLLWVLRDTLNMTGTKYGCGIAQCGACTVHVDGEPATVLLFPVSLVAGKKITTIEGLSTGQKPSGASKPGSGTSAAMRILPIGADHDRGCVSEKESETDTGRCGRSDVQQYMPLRNGAENARGSIESGAVNARRAYTGDQDCGRCAVIAKRFHFDTAQAAEIERGKQVQLS